MTVLELVNRLPEVYQPIFGHEDLSVSAARSCEDRLDHIIKIHEEIKKQIQRQVRVLDLGCAQGFFSFHLAAKGAIVHGVDFCQENVDLCSFLQAKTGLSAEFEHANIADVLDRLSEGDWDLVLGLSVFHHITHERGLEYTKRLLGKLAKTVPACIFEWALAVEPLYWASTQADSPRELMESFSFIHKIASHSTHLSQQSRPMYFCSSRFWYFGSALGAFNTATTTAGSHMADTHLGTRRLFDCDGSIVKVFGKIPIERADINRQEWLNEVAYLRRECHSIAVPELLESGENDEGFWLVRGRYEGVTLNTLIRNNMPYDAAHVAQDIIAQLAALEAEGLFHNDVRTWNIIVLPRGGARLIDFGSISREPRDVAWPFDPLLSVIITLTEIFGRRAAASIPYRSPWITPDLLPNNIANAFWQKISANQKTTVFVDLKERVLSYDGAPRIVTYDAISAAFQQAVEMRELPWNAGAQEGAPSSDQEQVVGSFDERDADRSMRFADPDKGVSAESMVRGELSHARGDGVGAVDTAVGRNIVTTTNFSIQMQISQLMETLRLREEASITQNATLNEWMASIGQQIVSDAGALRETIRTHEATIAANGAALADVQAAHVARTRELERLLAAVYVSTSWRISAPFRGVKQLLSGDIEAVKQSFSRVLPRFLDDGLRLARRHPRLKEPALWIIRRSPRLYRQVAHFVERRPRPAPAMLASAETFRMLEADPRVLAHWRALLEHSRKKV